MTSHLFSPLTNSQYTQRTEHNRSFHSERGKLAAFCFSQAASSMATGWGCPTRWAWRRAFLGGISWLGWFFLSCVLHSLWLCFLRFSFLSIMPHDHSWSGHGTNASLGCYPTFIALFLIMPVWRSYYRIHAVSGFCDSTVCLKTYGLLISIQLFAD